MEKGPVRVGTLALQVRQEIAPQLSGSREADDRGIHDGRTGAQRQLARQRRTGMAVLDRHLGEWMLEPQEPRTGDNGRAAHFTPHRRAGHVEIDQPDVGNRHLAADRFEPDLLPHVA